MNRGQDTRLDQFGALMDCIEAAALAPSVDNRQPWQFRIHRDRIDVTLDRERLVADTAEREGLISLGAAVLNLRVAILNAGYAPVTSLFPTSAGGQVAASVAIGPARRANESTRALASAISRRHTNRGQFRDVEVRDEVILQLTAAARVEGGLLAAAGRDVRGSILNIISEADGWPTQSATPTVAVLFSVADTRMDWLRTGQALERVLLTATVRGVANTPIAVRDDLPELNQLLTPSDRIRIPQVVLRLGYADPRPESSRRPLADMVTVVDAALRG
jgi:nitroreductase